ncbi:hypothetical protein [Thiohalocapsa sp. ML1]|jgi:hypothetical protein|uniref:hypothetical protein n=1 Tax=Thiohalocapsa sp. ML1 TaxID=1431688 RepID=UPI0007321E81|nr:hypothetical protein [Thiohalocapsa sp. ML1]
MLQHLLLRIEAVNLEQVIDDTDKIAVIRGGSFGALFGPQSLEPDPNGPDPEPLAPRWPLLSGLFWRGFPQHKPRRISTGASVGLYALRAPRRDAGRLADAVARALAERWPHHTFVVDTQPYDPANGDFSRAHEAVIAKNRMRQLRQAAVAIPAPLPGCRLVDHFDDLRPASADLRLDGDKTASASVYARAELGREQKDAFLHWASGVPDLAYARSFEDIAPGAGDLPAGDPLLGKLGVLYFDGNGFGAHQARCDSEHRLRAFDDMVTAFRRNWLAELIHRLADHPHAWHRPAPRRGKPPEPPRLRLELLLWGGDEILLVLPAGLALDALMHFYAISAAAHARGELTWPDAEGKPQPLTHAGGLVLCQHKVPIARTRELARRLADQIKARDDSRHADRWDYLLLESVDAPHNAPAGFHRTRYGPRAAERRPLAPAAQPDALARLAALRNPPAAAMPLPGDDPRLALGKARDLGFRLTRDADCAKPEQCDDLVRQLDALVPTNGPQREMPALAAQLFPGQSAVWRWLHLLELWDYLAPRTAEEP